MSKLYRAIKRGLRDIPDIYNLKKEKAPWYKAAWEAFYLSDIYDYLAEPFYFVRRYYNKCRKVIQFLPIVWQHEDWDSSYTLHFMHFLFKRMYDAIYINGHHVEHPNHKRRLKVATELLKRMSDRDDTYMQPHYDYLEKKFGPSNIDFEEVVDANGRKYTTLVDKRERTLDESQKVMYRKMKTYIYGDLEDKMLKQDMELFCKILKKDIRHWWD